MTRAQSADTFVPHPALGSVEAGTKTMTVDNQLGRFGEFLVREFQRASGYEVFDGNIVGKGIDVLAVKRDARGVLKEVKLIEVKTRSMGTDFRLNATNYGRQLSPEWIESRLARMLRELPDSPLRQLVEEIVEARAVRPEIVKPQLYGISVEKNVFRVLKADGVTEVATARLTRILERLSRPDVAPAIRRTAIRHLQQWDQILASRAAKTVVTVVIESAPRSATRAVSTTQSAVSSAARTAAASAKRASRASTVLGKVSESAAPEVSLLTKALPIAGATIAVAAEGAIRAYNAKEIERQYHSGEIDDRDRIDQHAKNLAGGVGGFGGAVALGGQGALWGATLGPIGAGVGGIAGGAVGYLGGEKLAEGAASVAKGAIYSTVNVARHGATWVGETSHSLWQGGLGLFGR